LSKYVEETNPGYQIAVAPNIWESSVWNLLHVTLLALRILRWLLDFGKICALAPHKSYLLYHHSHLQFRTIVHQPPFNIKKNIITNKLYSLNSDTIPLCMQDLVSQMIFHAPMYLLVQWNPCPTWPPNLQLNQNHMLQILLLLIWINIFLLYEVTNLVLLCPAKVCVQVLQGHL